MIDVVARVRAAEGRDYSEYCDCGGESHCVWCAINHDEALAELVPELVAEVKRLRAQVGRMRECR